MWIELRKSLLTAATLLCMAGPSNADTILKFGLSETGPDVEYDGTTFSTVDDGDASTLGEQNTGFNFTGPLDGVIADIFANASFTLSNVLASGAAQVVSNTVVQASTGGSFSAYDENNNLLLSGSIADGALTGSTGSSTGSYFNLNTVTFTGGSLLPFLIADSGGISIAMSGILSQGGVPSLVVNNGVLAPFSGNSTGLVDGQGAIPEPATALLLVSGAIGAAIRRRKAS